MCLWQRKCSICCTSADPSSAPSTWHVQRAALLTLCSASSGEIRPPGLGWHPSMRQSTVKKGSPLARLLFVAGSNAYGGSAGGSSMGGATRSILGTAGRLSTLRSRPLGTTMCCVVMVRHTVAQNAHTYSSQQTRISGTILARCYFAAALPWLRSSACTVKNREPHQAALFEVLGSRVMRDVPACELSEPK